MAAAIDLFLAKFLKLNSEQLRNIVSQFSRIYLPCLSCFSLGWISGKIIG